MTSDGVEQYGADPASEVIDELLSVEEKNDLDDAEQSPTEVTFSTQDFDVHGLVRRLERDSIVVPVFGMTGEPIETAGFQRNFVWKRPQMDRFIETLLLGYPTPGIFLVKQSNNKYLVLDGQQRLRTLQYFYGGVYAGKEFRLANVAAEFKGLTYKTLPEKLSLKLDDSYMQATIIDIAGVAGGAEAVYGIFERLNSGGTQLTPHEIRVALFAGPGIDYVQRLNMDPNWRALYGTPSPRIRDQELVLRILAMYLDHDSYARPLKSFLNKFIDSFRNDITETIREAGQLFLLAAELLRDQVGRESLRRSEGSLINAAQSEAIFVGVMTAIAGGNELTEGELIPRHAALMRDTRFIGATSRSTADVEAVKDRLDAAISHIAR